MANPLYGQNKSDSDLDVYGKGKEEIIITAVDRILTADESGATVMLNAATGVITLPAAAAGLKFKVILGVETTAGANVLTASAADCFFGTIPMYSSDTADQAGVAQQLTYAVAIAAPASYDAMKFVAATATIGGVVGTVIELTCVSDVAWNVSIPQHMTSANDPGTCALIVER